MDTRDNGVAYGLGIDHEMALAIYRVGSEQEYAEVNLKQNNQNSKWNSKEIVMNMRFWINIIQVLGNKGGVTIVNATGAVVETNPRLKISGVQLTFLTEDDKILLGTGWLHTN